MDSIIQELGEVLGFTKIALANFHPTTCSGLYPGRVDGRAYWGSTTGIYFLGLVGFSVPATYTIIFTVAGLCYSNSTTISGSETVTSTEAHRRHRK